MCSLSGFWISQKAIKAVYDAEDGMATPPHDHTAVKSLIYAHFQVSVHTATEWVWCVYM